MIIRNVAGPDLAACGAREFNLQFGQPDTPDGLEEDEAVPEWDEDVDRMAGGEW